MCLCMQPPCRVQRSGRYTTPPHHLVGILVWFHVPVRFIPSHNGINLDVFCDCKRRMSIAMLVYWRVFCKACARKHPLSHNVKWTPHILEACRERVCDILEKRICSHLSEIPVCNRKGEATTSDRSKRKRQQGAMAMMVGFREWQWRILTRNQYNDTVLLQENCLQTYGNILWFDAIVQSFAQEKDGMTSCDIPSVSCRLLVWSCAIGIYRRCGKMASCHGRCAKK